MSSISSATPHMAAAAPFLSSYLVMIITPDPIDFAIASLAALRGVSRALPMIMGIAAGTVLVAGAALIAGEGVSTILPAHIMEALAVAAMLFLAARIALSNPFENPSPALSQQSRLATAGFLLSVLDPMFAAFLFAGFAGSLHPLVNDGAGWVIVAALALIDLAWLVAIALLMSRSRIRRAVQDWHIAVRMASAAGLACLALAKLPALFFPG